MATSYGAWKRALSQRAFLRSSGPRSRSLHCGPWHSLANPLATAGEGNSEEAVGPSRLPLWRLLLPAIAVLGNDLPCLIWGMILLLLPRLAPIWFFSLLICVGAHRRRPLPTPSRCVTRNLVNLFQFDILFGFLWALLIGGQWLLAGG